MVVRINKMAITLYVLFLFTLLSYIQNIKHIMPSLNTKNTVKQYTIYNDFQQNILIICMTMKWEEGRPYTTMHIHFVIPQIGMIYVL